MRSSSEGRKGAATVAGVEPELLARLESGEESSRSLMEVLAVDLSKVVRSVFGFEVDFGVPAGTKVGTKSLGIVQRMKIVGQCLHERGLREVAAEHSSDIVRGFAPFAIRDDSIEETLELVKPFAADSHFGVREWAWLAVRPQIAEHLEVAIEILQVWVVDEDENVRRFTSEATRPRGVWCSHLSRLKLEPELGLGLLEPLRSDPSKYVRDSVANWLNDASKSRPDWVDTVTRRWSQESLTAETAYIVKRARRNLSEGI